MAKRNPFRFSTKYQDDETDLPYYGYRYYGAGTGRWLSRDPIEEKGGLNPYGFVRNYPIGNFDALGLRCCLVTYPAGGGYEGHSILKCDNGAYVSLFPAGKPLDSPPQWRDPATDANYFKGRTPEEDCTDCLDESRVSKWLADAKSQNNNYKCFSANCSDATMKAIAAGLPDDRNKKPDCSCNIWERLGGGYKYVKDILNSGGLTLPSGTAAALAELIDNGCNRYKCVWTLPPQGR